MLLLVGPLLFVVLLIYAVRAKNNGLSGWEVAGKVVVGSLCIIMLMFGITMLAFSGFF